MLLAINYVRQGFFVVVSPKGLSKMYKERFSQTPKPAYKPECKPETLEP